MVDFHKSKFIANNAVMVVVGDVQRATVMSQVENAFGAWAQGTIEPDNVPSPPQRTSR